MAIVPDAQLIAFVEFGPVNPHSIAMMQLAAPPNTDVLELEMAMRGAGAVTNGNAFPDTTPDRPYLSDYAVRDGSALQVELSGPAGEKAVLRVEARIASNNQLSLEQMCEAGLGVGMLAPWVARKEIESGALVSLPSYPFARLRCWLPEPAGDAPALARALDEIVGDAGLRTRMAGRSWADRLRATAKDRSASLEKASARWRSSAMSST